MTISTLKEPNSTVSILLPPDTFPLPLLNWYKQSLCTLLRWERTPAPQLRMKALGAVFCEMFWIEGSRWILCQNFVFNDSRTQYLLLYLSSWWKNWNPAQHAKVKLNIVTCHEHSGTLKYCWCACGVVKHPIYLQFFKFLTIHCKRCNHAMLFFWTVRYL